MINANKQRVAFYLIFQTLTLAIFQIGADLKYDNDATALKNGSLIFLLKYHNSQGRLFQFIYSLLMKNIFQSN
jgi:hypothetical protein